MRTLACAALAALMLTLAACGGGVSFDVSATQPLGSLAQMESVVKGKERFTRSQRNLTRPECFNDLDDDCDDAIDEDFPQRSGERRFGPDDQIHIGMIGNRLFA